MKFLAIVIAVVISMTASVVSTANAQCFIQSRNVVAVQGNFNSFGGVGFAQQRVQIPQSTAFFAGGNQVAFVNQPVIFNAGFSPLVQQQFVQQQFVQRVVQQRVVVRSGLFGLRRRVVVRNFVVQQPVAVAVNAINTFPTVQIGRRNVFIGGF